MKKVLVIGSINQDTTLTMVNMPTPGETVIADGLSQSLGGKGANQAVTISRQNVPVEFVGVVGNDSVGNDIINFLKVESIGTEGILLKDTPTGSAIISLDKTGENSIIVFPGANYDFKSADLEIFEHLFNEADYCVLQLEIPIEVVEKAIDLSNKHSVAVILNPAPFNNDLDLSLLNKVEYYIPNETEFLLSINESTSSKNNINWFKEKGIEFAEKYDTKLILTLGSNGSLLCTRDSATLVKANKVSVVDTTAAGDSFIGSFVSHLSKGESTIDSMQHASRVAATVIQKQGAVNSIPRLSENNEFIY